jgi:hypothetical protein
MPAGYPMGYVEPDRSQMLGPDTSARGFKPVSRRRTSAGMDFEKAYAAGENPLGFTAQTVNGTAHYRGTGWNRDQPWSSEQISPAGPWKDGDSNRSGE